MLRMLSEFLTEPVFAKGLSVSGNSMSHHLITTDAVYQRVCWSRRLYVKMDDSYLLYEAEISSIHALPS